MPSATVMQTNFSAGELSPRLFARVDVAKYTNGCYRLENFIAQRYGGIRKRGGSEFIEEVKDSSSEVRLIPFVYSVTQAYILEFGPLYIRIYTNGGRLEVASVPVEVATPYTAATLFDLQFAQSADVLYISHPDYAPRTLSRTSATTFVLETIEFEDGPYLELNKTVTTLTPASTADLTSVVAGTPSTSPAPGAGAVANLFDDDPGSIVVINQRTGVFTYTFTSGTHVCDGYFITATSASHTAPSTWRFEGFDGSSWVTLDTRTAENGWGGGETRFFSFLNSTGYEAYRIDVLGQNDPNTDFLQIAEIGMHQSVDDQTAFNLTASSIVGINDDTGFQTSDVGRAIRLLGSDGRWRWAKIITRASTTVVTVKIYDHALYDISSVANWRLGAWSTNTGFPACVGFYTGRLCFARTATQPQTVWMSVVDDFQNHEVSDPLEDDDAINATISSESINVINWIAEGTDLFLGTTAAIRTIGPTSSAAAFSPTNIRQKRETNYGAGEVLPVRVGTTALYTGYYRKDIREISYSFDFNGYISNDLSILSEHIPALGVKQIAYAQAPDSVVWFVTDDGGLAGMTYERDQEVIAFHRHTIAGTSVAVESVATIPGTTSDEVWVVVRRTIDGGVERYIERISEGISETGAKESATFLDSYLTYSGASTTTITGLDHLEGEDVYVWSGTKQGPYAVTSGSITIGTAVTSAIVGLAYTSTMETLSPEAAARAGTAQTRLGRISEVFVRLNRSMNGMVGPADGTLETIEYAQGTDNEGDYGVATEMFTGDARVPISMAWERQKRLKMVHAEPSPFHCLGLITEIRVSG